VTTALPEPGGAREPLGAGRPGREIELPPDADVASRGLEPEADLDRAAELLANGRVVAVPTETVYGLAVDPRRESAVASLFALKGRPESVALPVLIAEPGDAEALGMLDDRARALVDRYWPGPLTLVLRRRAGAVMHLGGDPASIGLRCPAHLLTRRLIAVTGPLAVTSANRHGGSPARAAAEVEAIFGRALELVVDGGHCDGDPSTVVSLLGDPSNRDGLSCLREGAIPFEEIRLLVNEVVRGRPSEAAAPNRPGCPP
jgi:L-threonylcarbamoyladenylate synthase